MRLPQLTTRRLMVVVAVVAVGIEGWRLFQWSQLFQEEARYHSSFVQLTRPMIAVWEANAAKAELAAESYVERDRAAAELMRNSAVRHRRMAADGRKEIERRLSLFAKYRRAARYPWFPVPPDPPGPE